MSSPIGQSAALRSRSWFLTRLEEEIGSSEKLKILAGSPEQFTNNIIVFINGGAVASSRGP